MRVEDVEGRWFCIEQAQSKDLSQFKAIETQFGRAWCRVRRRHIDRSTGERMGEWETVRECSLKDAIALYNGMG